MSNERMLAIALAYLKYRLRVEGIPNLNSLVFQERMRRTVMQPEFLEIQLTLEEALELIRRLGGEQFGLQNPAP